LPHGQHNLDGGSSRLLGVGKPALSELAVRGIVHRGEKRGTYLLEGSVSGYCRYLVPSLYAPA
jgi:hypothetical protein